MINGFFGEYRFLSNFYPCLVEFEGESYPSVEHAYQAAKTLDPQIRAVIRKAATPGSAKRMGKTIPIRADWEAVKITIMRKLVQEKFFENPTMKALLIETKKEELVEGNTWGDTFWGKCNGVGQNWLGRLLMEARSHMKEWQDKYGHLPRN